MGTSRLHPTYFWLLTALIWPPAPEFTSPPIEVEEEPPEVLTPPERLLPLPRFSFEPYLKPPTASCELDHPRLGGIDILPEGPCPKCCGIGGTIVSPRDAGFPFGSGIGVYLHSGELFLYQVDLEIPGRGFNWRFARKYRSGLSFNGPLGRGWEFNYDRRLVVVNEQNLAQVRRTFPTANLGDVVRLDGMGRVDLYAWDSAQEKFTSPVGFYTRLVRLKDGSFLEQDFRRVTAIYGPPNAEGVAVMTELRDRHGNTMRFEYDDKVKLRRVWDTLGRPIDYHWNEEGKLIAIQDFVGRRIEFIYDHEDHLIEVRSPRVTGTPNRNDFPEGRSISYRYDSNHRMDAIIAPNEVATTGQPKVHVFYDSLGRVVNLRLGGFNKNGIPSGGDIKYFYENGVTHVIDSNGNKTDYFFNSLGNVIAKKEYTNKVTDPNFFETKYK